MAAKKHSSRPRQHPSSDPGAPPSRRPPARTEADTEADTEDTEADTEDTEDTEDGAFDSAVTDVLAGQHEHYEDPLLYDFEYRRRRKDARFYVGVVSELEGGPGDVLELACGSGRVTVPLLRAGHAVVGLDLSAAMLLRARARIDRLGRDSAARAFLIRGDMRRFALGRRFPVIVMAFNSFEHLYTRTEVSACLERVRDHLEPGGHFVFDVQNPNPIWLARDPGRRWARTRFTHPRTGQRLVYSTNHDYDPISQIASIRLYYTPIAGEQTLRKESERSEAPERPSSNAERVVRLSQRKFFPAELEALLHHAGFRVTARLGDFDGEPLHGGCESQVIVCRHAGQAACGGPAWRPS